MNSIGNFTIIKDSLRCLNDSICDWESLKRSPQLFRHKFNTGHSRTNDDVFDQLYYELVQVKLSLGKLAKNCSFFSSATNMLLDTLDNINTIFVKLAAHKQDVATSDYRRYSTQVDTPLSVMISQYQKTVYSARDTVSDQVKLLDEGVSAKVSQIQTMIAQIDKKITTRLNCLVTYDTAYNEHDLLYLKQNAGEILSTKKSQRLMLLDRKLEKFKQKYDEINELLKKELKVFLTLVRTFINELKSHIYYVHLLIIYQLQSHIESFAQGNHLTVPLIEPNQIMAYLKEVPRSVVEYIDSLYIIKIRDKYLEDLLADNPDGVQLCRALFDFNKTRDDELSFKKNDIIKILEKDGLWWKGELADVIGYLPSNHVEEMEQT